MSLPALQWRKLPVRTIQIAMPTASYVLNTIYDMLTGSLYHDGSTRTLGSGSAWQMPSKFVTGSNTEAVYVFPGFQTAVSQSVIFVSRGQIGASSSASPLTVTSEPSFSSSFIYMSCVKNASGSFTQWTSAHPFGSGSALLGYAPFTQTNQISANHKIVLYESKEALAVYMYDIGKTLTSVFGVAGSIIDPEQSGSSLDTEIDGRLYAVATTGVSTVSGSKSGLAIKWVSDVASDAGVLFQHSAAVLNNNINNYSRFVFFLPNTINKSTAQCTKNGNGYHPISLGYSNYTTLSEKLVRTPVYCSDATDGKFLGRLRDISVIRQIPSNAVVRDSSNNILGYSFGYSETTASQAMLLNYS